MPYKDPAKQSEYQARWYKDHAVQVKASARLSATACKYRNIRFVKRVKAKGCVVCGYKRCPEAIDFHHVGKKEMAIGKAANQMRWSIKRLKNEMRQCVRLCANCHRELHAGLIEISQKTT